MTSAVLATSRQNRGIGAEREIERRRKLGITNISDIDPHPDDLLVDMATREVHVKDELNPKDSRMLKGLRKPLPPDPFRHQGSVIALSCYFFIVILRTRFIRPCEAEG
jgi:hypothetical protein